MKRTIHILLCILLCAFLLIPMTAYAETYYMSDTDMRISIDDSLWYVFTRDNIKDNPELEEVGISYDNMCDILYNNQAYMNAAVFYEDGEFLELFIRKKTLDSGIANLSNYDNDRIMEMAKELADRQNAEDYCVYENQYKFIKMEYFDANFSYYVCEYITVVNRDNYTLTFQSEKPFDQWEYEEIGQIVDSIHFDVDPSIKEKKTDSSYDNILVKTVCGAIAGGAAGAVVGFVNKKKKSKKHSDCITEDQE